MRLELIHRRGWDQTNCSGSFRSHQPLAASCLSTCPGKKSHMCEITLQSQALPCFLVSQNGQRPQMQELVLLRSCWGGRLWHVPIKVVPNAVVQCVVQGIGHLERLIAEAMLLLLGSAKIRRWKIYLPCIPHCLSSTEDDGQASEQMALCAFNLLLRASQDQPSGT